MGRPSADWSYTRVTTPSACCFGPGQASGSVLHHEAGRLRCHDSPLRCTVFFSARRQISSLAAMHRLPAMYESREFVDDGGLISYGASIPDLTRRAAAFVVKIINGAKPADLPIEQPTKFELLINLKTAKALGLEVPPTLLARADEVIE